MVDIHAVLFDFDGTLAPNLDLPDMRRQVIAQLTEAGVPEPVFEGRYMVEMIDVAKTWMGEHDAHKAQRMYEQTHHLIRDFEMAASANTSIFPGVEPYLEDLRQRGFRVGVVTRNCRAAVLTVCPQLLSLVDTLRARDDVHHLKPDTRHLLDALRDLDSQPQHAAMVGDGRLDMHSGKAAGLHCIGVESGSSNAEELLAAGADRVFRDCCEFVPRPPT